MNETGKREAIFWQKTAMESYKIAMEARVRNVAAYQAAGAYGSEAARFYMGINDNKDQLYA